MNTSLLADKARADALSKDARDMISIDLNRSQVNDLELLLNGAYAPITGYLTQENYHSVCDSMRLKDGALWPLPLSLEITGDIAEKITTKEQIALRDPEGVLLAILAVEDIFEKKGKCLLGGRVEGITLPLHYDHRELRLPPPMQNTDLQVALVTSGILHREELAAAAHFANENNSRLLIQALDSGDDDIFGRIRCIKAALANCSARDTRLSILPATASNDARGWLLQAIIAGNYGCSSILSSGDMSLIDEHSAEIAITGVSLPEGASEISPEVSEELKRIYPQKDQQGFTVFFSGLSGSGKSTIANILRVKLLERATRNVTLLDGDIVRKNLSSELTFSREHRDLNILRIGFVAGEITRHRGVAICAPIAPYDAIRKKVRSQIGNYGGFILVHVATPLEVCEARDRKGLYAMARAGKISEFTGISDPYETPADAELTIQTTEISAEQACNQVIEYLEKEGYLEPVTNN